jgi:hypothetical protein
LTPDDLIGAIAEAGIDPTTAAPLQVASILVRKKLLTKFQAMQLLNGRTQGFVLVGAQLGMSEGAVKVAAHRLRRRYRAMLRDEIAQTVDDSGQIADEVRYLLSCL